MLAQTAKILNHPRHDDEPIEMRHLSAGLLAQPARVSAKYLYDALGSKLFEAICCLPEYYPTRTEAAIFEEHLDEIARTVGRGSTLIDLGAGNCAKAARLFPVLRPGQYVAIDISGEFLHDAVSQLRLRFPQIDMLELQLDFSGSLNLPLSVRRERRLFFYPGSSIGNFTPTQALQFLRRLRHECQTHANGGLLIGVDLVKNTRLLDAAYNDAIGVTAAFNLNLLQHVNRLLDADFDVREWLHRSFFDVTQSRIEMHLVARHAVAVNWRGGQRLFAPGESIHTENSYKYTREGFLNLLAEAGFGKVRTWSDASGWFLLCHAAAE
ncbi:MAG: L-histidine N(alpha)-methyltransferase [Burkholderiaceae bacterium]|nr:L-histidine N(alpha)-methyltransferase [Burkholderiaceae bacterium]